MFERFTERARQVVVLARSEARALGHNYIGTEHLLLGLLSEEQGKAFRALANLDITFERVREQVQRVVGSSDEGTGRGQIPFTPRAKKTLELALREALGLGHNYIGTEHILLGLVRQNEGVAATILLDFDADTEKIRDEVLRLLQRSAGAPAGGPTLPPSDHTLDAEAEATRREREATDAEAEPNRARRLAERERRLRDVRERLRALASDVATHRQATKAAIEAQEFERAAAARDRERRLRLVRREVEACVSRIGALRIETEAAIDTLLEEIEGILAGFDDVA